MRTGNSLKFRKFGGQSDNSKQNCVICQQCFLFTQELIHFTQGILPLLLKKLRTLYSRNLRVPRNHWHRTCHIPLTSWVLVYGILYLIHAFCFKFATRWNCYRSLLSCTCRIFSAFLISVIFFFKYHHHHHHHCSAQGQVLHCKLRHQDCNSAQRQVFHCKHGNQGCTFTRDE